MNVATDIVTGEAGRARQAATALDIQRRLVDHIRHKTTDREPGPMRQSGNIYTSQHWYELEMEKAFRALPMLVGMTCDIPEAGNKLLFDEVGPPIVIVRTGSGKLRAYLNMCTHRAARLVSECTASKRMTCPFHSWTFNLEGELIGQPGAQSFAGIAKSEFRLIEVPVEEWHGLIFVIARPGTAADIDVATFLGAMGPELAQLNLGEARFVKADRLEVASNWKYAYDTYGEGYHFNSLHATTIAQTAHTDMMALDKFGLHQRLNFPYRDQDACVDRPEEEWARRPYGGVHMIFPNTVIQVATFGPGSVFGLYRLYPDGGPDKAFSMMRSYRSGTIADDVDMTPWRDHHDFIMKVIEAEDYSVSESGQRNVRYAPAGFNMTFGSNEGALQTFHRNLAQLIGRND